ncbi:MAG TPA: aromatic ring-hydroxylating dioxygenase subunit alpha, partial [Polyangiaceae bacterium]|nr:aromatic ring-hydroxylating dioxygenase subunit alpha [Polyangiaceae bacterium]
MAPEPNPTPREVAVDSAHDRAKAALLRPKATLSKPLRYWYAIATSDELGHRPLARTLFDAPIVVFRTESGRAAALVDRCPHRNVPLSLGKVRGERIACAYHGWELDTDGACRFVPSLVGDAKSKSRRAPAYAVREQQGIVWLWGKPDDVPDKEPHRFAMLRERGYTTVRRTVEAKGTLYSTLENALDVPHTAFLHRGLFRSESRGITITANVERTADRVVAEYLGEPRPPGIVARILSPSGGTVSHFDRFIMPSIAQVEYRIGDENHFLVDSVMTPVSDFVTRIHAVVSYRMRIPGFLLRPLLTPLALRVFQQDALILAEQTETIRRFGGESFASTEIDVLGKHI